MVTRGGGGSRQTVTNGEKGGGGVKNRDFYGDILFDPKLAEKSLSLCLTEHIRMSKSHIEWQQESRINKKTMFYVFKTSETDVSKSEKFQVTVH